MNTMFITRRREGAESRNTESSFKRRNYPPTCPANSAPPRETSFLVCSVIAASLSLLLSTTASAQLPTIRTGEAIRRAIREIYDRGVPFLVCTQAAAGQCERND